MLLYEYHAQAVNKTRVFIQLHIINAIAFIRAQFVNLITGTINCVCIIVTTENHARGFYFNVILFYFIIDRREKKAKLIYVET